ncbi:MAG: hypothetical protein GY936_03015 [Ignavibacteriae bacterium]|nr:hypothetical protein [Ignavibacteriota bacterium]
MKTYYEPSIFAYNLLQEVTKSLNITETPEVSLTNGNVNKIIQNCNAIIDSKETETNTKELLKYYIVRSFFEDYDLGIEDDYSNVAYC